MSAAPRIAPATAPYPPEVQARFEALMPPGVAPLGLLRTLARDLRLFQRFMGGGLLDKGHLALRQREIVIGRVTARCGSEYEWGVHVAFFAKRVGFDEAQLRSLVHGCADDACWTAQRCAADPLVRRPARQLRCRRCPMGGARRPIQRGGDIGAAAAGRLLPHGVVSHQRAPASARALRRAVPGLRWFPLPSCGERVGIGHHVSGGGVALPQSCSSRCTRPQPCL